MFLQFIEFFNPCKIYPEEFNNSITLYEYSIDVLFVNESQIIDPSIPTSPIELEGRDSHSLGKSMTVSRKVSYDNKIKLMLTFEDNISFGDTHRLVDGVVYFGKKKYTVTQCVLHRNLTVGDKTYDYIVKCIIK
jgi:hypothetical protein